LLLSSGGYETREPEFLSDLGIHLIMTFSSLFRLLIASLCLAVITGSFALGAAIRDIEGYVILVRGGATAEYLWDATSYVGKLVSSDTLGSAGMRAIEATSVAALAQEATESRAATLSLRVVYKPLSANSIYGKPTFAGQKGLLVVTVPRVGIAKNGANWARSVADGKIPAPVRLRIVSQLPAAQ